MCLMLYMATNGDLRVRNSPELSVEEVEPSREAVRQWFSLPVVRFIGAHTGCSCGFPHVIAEEPVEYWEGMFDDQDREADLSSVESLLVLVREHVRATGEVQLYTVWDGEEGSPPKGVINVGLDSLNRETFFLNERFFYCVATNGEQQLPIPVSVRLCRWFPDGKPIGKHVQMSGTREIVGVIGDVLQGNPKQETTPQLFVPYAQRPTRSLWLVVRTAAHPRMLAPSLRATMRRFDANLAVSELTLLDHLRAGAIARPRFYTTLLALFAVVALALAVTGIFGVMSYTVAERTREIGIRMALGAHRADVLRMIVGRAVALALIGAAIGLAAALAIGRVIRNQLFGVDVLDPPTLSTVILILLTSVAAASLLPAQRAARLDPGRTLRHG